MDCDDPLLLVFMFLWRLFLHWIAPCKNDGVWPWRLGHKRQHNCNFDLLDSLLWRKWATVSWGHTCNPVEMTVYRGTKASHQQPAPAYLGSGCSSLSWALRWLQSWLTSWVQPHEKPWATTTQPSHPQILDLQKLQDNKYLLLFYITKSRVIFFTQN